MSQPDQADLHVSGKPLPTPADCKVVNPDFWRSGLICNKEGEPKRSLANVMHVFSLHPHWCGVFAWDAFGFAVVTQRKPPMRPQDAPPDYQCGDWTDEDSARTVAWFASEVGFEPPSTFVDQAVATIARKTTVHPVRDWLSSLEWDGTPRLDTFASRYLGATRSTYTAAVGRRWLIAAVARVFEPGCKVDSVLGLEGQQGIGKSSALKMLAGPQWFSDSTLVIGEKDSYQALRRKWIHELSELASIKGRSLEKVKSFVSSSVDTFRASYGRRTQDHPRQVVFASTTNEDFWLGDPTGSRRNWPIRCGAIDLPALKRDRDQLWAEATAAYQRGEPWFLDTPELRALAAEETSQREERDDWIDVVARWLATPTAPRAEDGITTVDVLLGALAFSPDRVTPAATTRCGHVLRKLGFEPRQQRVSGSSTQRERRYFRTSDTGSDDSAAQNGSSHMSQPVTGTYTHTKDNHGTLPLIRVGAKPGETPVTCDTDVERQAIQAEARLVALGAAADAARDECHRVEAEWAALGAPLKGPTYEQVQKARTASGDATLAFNKANRGTK